MALVLILMGWAVVVPGYFGLIPERAGSGVLGTVAAGSTIGIGLIALCLPALSVAGGPSAAADGQFRRRRSSTSSARPKLQLLLPFIMIVPRALL